MADAITCPGCGEAYDPSTPLTFQTWMHRHEEHYNEYERTHNADWPNEERGTE
jgi:hypothetical protein